MSLVPSKPAPGLVARFSAAPLNTRAKWLRRSLIALIVILLEAYGRFVADPTLFAPPSRIVHSLFVDIFSDPNIVWALVLCIIEIAVAYILAIVFGIAIGLGVGATPFSRRALYPVIILIYVIPQVSFLPLFVLVFGLGAGAKIAFGFSHAIFPIIVNVVAGMRNVRELYVNAARSMGASRSQIIRHVMIPHMVPSLFTGLRLAMTLNLLGVILAELYVSSGGVGFFTRMFAEDFNPAPLFALIGSLAFIAVLFNELVRLAENALTPGGDTSTRKNKNTETQ